MNIFVLNEDPSQAARDMCNKHVVKMLVETAQILSTAFRLKMEEHTGVPDRQESFNRLYKATHRKHPAIQWTMESVHNTDWVWQHAEALYREYVERYKKHHKTGQVLNEFNGLRWLMWQGYGAWQQHTPFVQCMPNELKGADAVEAYQRYYITSKARFARWAPRARPPAWWPFNEQVQSNLIGITP